MSLNDRDKLNRIEALKGKLFSKDYQTKIEHRDTFTHLKREDIQDTWESERKDADSGYSPDKFFKKTPVFKNFFIFSLVFFVMTLGYASYVFFIGGNTVSNNNIDISILGNNFTAGGEELSLIVGVTNRNNSALLLADLVIEYPKSSSNRETALSAGNERSRLSLGTIPVGAIRNENLKLVLFGEQGSVKPIKISLEYRIEGSNAIFVKEKFYDVTINSTPLNLSIDAPDTISPNQDITFKVKETLNATKPSPKILLKLDYPVGFVFISSTPTPSLGNNIWNLGDLAPGAERNISITGKIIDAVDGEEKNFHISSGSQAEGDKSMIGVVFNSVSHIVTIKKPFIEANLSINGVSQREYAIDTKTPILGQIEWTNNLDTKVNDLKIIAKISGNAVNRKTIDADRGFYDSATDTITWDKSSQNQFGEINPGDSGYVSFSLATLPLFSAAEGMLASPLINIEVSISGKQLVQAYETTDLNNFQSGVIRIISDVGFAAKALYYSGPFVNQGPIPPKVEEETTYTIVWSVSNTTNNISKGIVRSSLPAWVRFIGPISPPEEDLIYNPATKELIWNIGNLLKGTGILGSSRSVSFQIGFSPSFSQINTIPIIINDATLTGYDDFAKVEVRVNRTSLRTSLDNDSLFPSAGGMVIE